MKEENSDNQLKDLFKGKFADEYLAPPKSAWSNIQGQMAAPGRIRKPLYYWLIPVGLIVLVGGGIAINSVFSTNRVQTSSVSENDKLENQITENEENSTSNELEENVENIKSANDTVTFNEINILKKDIESNQFKNELPIKKQAIEQKPDSKTSTTNSADERAKDPITSKQKGQKTTVNNSDNTSFSNNSKLISNSKSKTTTVSEKVISTEESTTTTKKSVNQDLTDLKNLKENQNSLAEPKTTTKTVGENEKIVKGNNTTPDKKVETNATKPIISETPTSNVSIPKEEKIKTNEEPSAVKNEITSETKPVKSSELKNLEKEVVTTSPDDKVQEKPELKPEVTESNVLLNSVVPRNNLRYDFYLGKGKSPRRSTFYGNNVDNPAIYLADKSVNMNNTVMGFNVRYQITPYFAMRSGIAGGQDRFQTRLFSVTLGNSQLGENIKIASADGILQATGLSSDKLPSNGTDSSIYDMQIFHRQGYLTIPISFVVNTKIQPGKLYYYGSTGFDFMAKGKGRNLLIVKDGELSRNVFLNRISDVSRIYTNWNLALGLAYPFKSRFDLFTELNYSLDISKRLKSSYLITNSSHVQLVLGLRF